MAEYIDREKLLEELKESAKHHANNSREESLLYRDRAIIREQSIADVIERTKIDKAIEEIESEIARFGTKGMFYLGLNFSLKAIKRNIGE